MEDENLPQRTSITEYLLEEIQIDALGIRFPFVAGAIVAGGIAYLIIMGRKHYIDYNE